MAVDDHRTARETIELVIACVVTLVWVISFTVDVFVRDYDPPASVMPVMLIVAGWLFTKNVFSKAKEEESHK
jgi:hypothetical protein